jgi:esterase/lipase superfamily enzyme
MALSAYRQLNPGAQASSLPQWGKQSLLIALLISLCGCQSGILTRVKDSSANVVSSIRNIPAAIIPSGFESKAYIDRDFSVPNASLAVDGEHAVIKTFFATNRTAHDQAPAETVFRDARASSLSFGKAYVTLKRTADTFAIEPDTLAKVNMVNPPELDAVLSHNEVFTRKRLGGEVGSELTLSGENSLLIYVHGFNVSFESAAIRSAQLSYDIGFPGTTVFYSWPALGGASAYIADSESAAASQRQFEAMLSELLYQASTTKVYLVAHNMGARIASRALKSVFLAEPSLRVKMREVVLIAPDIDTHEFNTELAPFIGTVEQPVTVYVSKKDPALVTAKSLTVAPIIGDSVFISGRVETIDAANAQTSLTGHSNYAATDSIIGDIWYLIKTNLRANSRNSLEAKYTQQGTYWEYGH